jgi:hypothetical protein
MTPFYQFVLAMGLTLGAAAVTIAWLFRVAPLHIGLRIAVCMALAGLACWTPFTARGLMGYPVAATKYDIPDHTQLLLFYPHDQLKLVDLWTLGPGAFPMAYEIPMDAQMQKTLEEAARMFAEGKAVFLSRARGNGTGQETKTGKAATPSKGAVTNFEDDYDNGLTVDHSGEPAPKGSGG